MRGWQTVQEGGAPDQGLQTGDRSEVRGWRKEEGPLRLGFGKGRVRGGWGAGGPSALKSTELGGDSLPGNPLPTSSVRPSR